MKRTLISIAIFLFFASSSAHALSASGKLRDWRYSSASEKLEFAREVVRLTSTRATPREIVICIDEIAGDGGLDSQDVKTAAAVCATLL